MQVGVLLSVTQRTEERGIDFHFTNILGRETDTGVLRWDPQPALQVAAEGASVPHQQSAAFTGGSSFPFTDELIVFSQ